jgi:hypothetical protein
MSPEKLEWRGCLLTWKHESWPSFNNDEQPQRPFFCEVAPLGTLWRAKLRGGSGGADLRIEGPSAANPIAALEAARVALVEQAGALFGGEQ